MIRFSLKEIMSLQRVSIQELADNTGLSRTTISNISNNLAQGIQLDTLDKILKYLGVTVADIIEFKNDYSFQIKVISINYEKKIISAKFNFENHVAMKDVSIPFYVDFEHINKMTNFNFFNEQTRDDDITFITKAILEQGRSGSTHLLADNLKENMTDLKDSKEADSFLSIMKAINDAKELLDSVFQSFNIKFALSFFSKLKDDHSKEDNLSQNWNDDNKVIDLAYSFNWKVLPTGSPLSGNSMTHLLTYDDIMSYANKAIEN
nr:MAG TPA: Cro/C1-type HTH DNA-binding domain protein [Caudoviricetes sp.]